MRISMMNEDQLRELDVASLCFANVQGPGREKALGEIERREVFASDEMRLIQNRRVAIGMTEDALACSWGKPHKINRSTGGWGTRAQWIYPSTDTSLDASRTYIYVENGRVSAWQD